MRKLVSFITQPPVKFFVINAIIYGALFPINGIMAFFADSRRSVGQYIMEYVLYGIPVIVIVLTWWIYKNPNTRTAKWYVLIAILYLAPYAFMSAVGDL